MLPSQIEAVLKLLPTKAIGVSFPAQSACGWVTPQERCHQIIFYLSL